jgi:DegV family protein with EDD domain
MLKIITDSTSDLDTETTNRLGIGVAPTILEIDGQTFYDNVTLTREQFYRDMPMYRDFPKTAAAAPATFVELYRAANADEIISIHLSKKLSGMYRAAKIAADDIEAEGVRVHVVDSTSVSMGSGWQVIVGAEMAQQGANADEVLRDITRIQPGIRLYAMFDTLKYLRKGGRVSALTAGIGELIQLKLLVDIRDGGFTPLDKIRTRSRGVERLIEAGRSNAKPSRLAVLHTGANERDIRFVQERLSDIVPVEKQLVVMVTPGLGAHAGPNGLGVSLMP